MPHQETVTVIAEVPAGQFAPLQQLLGRIPDHVNDWSVIPFSKLRRLHFARIISFAATVDLEGRPVPAQVALLTNVDAPLSDHLDDLSTVCGEGIDAVFSHCVGYPGAGERSPATRRAFLQARLTKSSAVHINRRGRSVEQIRQEERLRKEIGGYLDSADFGSLRPTQVKERIVAFVRGRPDLNWALSPPEPPALSWRIKEALHAVFGLLLALVLSPLLLLGLPLFLVLLRAPREARRAGHVRRLPGVGAGVSRRRGLLGPQPDRGDGLPQAGRLPPADHGGHPRAHRLRDPAHLQPRASCPG